MAVRYSFILIPDPSFLRLIHTSRQILCNQFGCWTAEMFMIHVPLINFFKSESIEVSMNDKTVQGIVNDCKIDNWTLIPSCITNPANTSLDLYIDCLTPNQANPFINIKQRLMTELKIDSLGTSSDRLRIPLLENFDGNPTVWEEAITMAKDLFDNFGLNTPFDVRSLNLVKYESKSASDQWEREKWCSDISWDILESFKLG